MKTKLPKILGVALTLMLVISLFAFGIPVAAQAPPATWGAQAIPTAAGNVILNGSDVGDIAVSSDGTIYAINNGPLVNASLAGAVLVSKNAGQTFTALAAVGGAAGRFLNAIAVAPDDSNQVIVTDGINTFITSDGGTTWTALGLPAATGTTPEILDVDVSAAIPGSIFGRHYVRAVADAAAAVRASTAEMIGVATTGWAAIGAPATNGDYMAVKFSPNYMGDRGLAVLYNTGAATFFDIISQPGTAAQALTQTAPLTAITSVDYEAEDAGIATAGALVCGDIALPSDWDPSLPAGQVSYISVGSSLAATAAGVADRGSAVAIASPSIASDDVYRVDAGAAMPLNGVTSVPVNSIAYSGTISEGTLFLGERLQSNVKYTLNSTSAAPTWKSTQKAPTGDNIALPEACTVVRVAPDFATSSTVYVGTRDAWTVASAVAGRRSAFSVSVDAGVTFNQTALIDVKVATLVLLDDVMVTPDGATVFLSSDDGTDLSLWKSTTPTNAASWERVYCQTAAGPSIIRLAPDYATAPSVFWANTAAANLWVSHDGGNVFSNRTPPAAAVDIAVERGGATGVLYLTNATNIYKSTNGGYFFGLPIPTGLPVAGVCLSMAPMYPALPEAGNLLVGATACMAYSVNGAASFIAVSNGLAAAGGCIIGADEDYASNSTIYIVGLVSGSVYRFVVGTDTAWTDVSSDTPGAPTAFRGLAINNGALYAAHSVINLGVARTLGPLAAAGTLTWRTMDTGAAVGATFTKAPNCLRVANNEVWAIDTAAAAPGALLAYGDYLATISPAVNSPPDAYSVGIDPNNGTGYPVMLTWDAMGSGNGMVTAYAVLIWETAAGVGSGSVLLTGNLGAFALTPAVELGPAAPIATMRYTLKANTGYTWMVRARDEVSTDLICSQWSAPRTMQVEAGSAVVQAHAGPILLGPQRGAMDVSLTPGFSWAPISGATEYEFTLATDAALANAIEGTPVTVTQPSWQVPAGSLEYSTTYFWSVKASAPTSSPLSIGTFITMAEPVEPLPPVVIEPTPPPAQIAPAYIWGIIGIGAILVIVVLALIVRTRRTM